MKATFKGRQTVEQVHTIAKTLGEKEVTLEDLNPTEVETLMRQAGNKIGSVHFVKRKDGSLRKMCYRLHVQNPTNARKPKGQSKVDRKIINEKNTQMVVFDVNKVHRNKDGEIKKGDDGKQLRGAWRTVPLEKVVRVCVDGIVYQIGE
jgi:hypothetical protein